MKLGLFLAIGESLKDFESKGQLKRLINYNVKKYSLSFEEVYIFSYRDEDFKLPPNCYLVTNKYHLHRYLYSLLMPILNYSVIKECDVLRGLQLTGGIPAFVSKLLLGKKFVINYGYDYSDFASIEGKPLQSILYLFIQSPILKLADSIIVPSKTIYERLKKKYGVKVVHIANGVDTNLFHPASPKTNKKIIDVVFIGRLERQKNLDSLIKAVKNINEPYTMTFYGNGSEQANLSKLAENLKTPLQIKAPIDYEEVAKVLRSCDIFVLPSHKEGSPKILLEAMASGCAIVASNVSQITEIIKNGETGILCSQDSQDIERALRELLDLKKRQQLGKNARKLIQDNYEINKLLSKEIDMLKNLSR